MICDSIILFQYIQHRDNVVSFCRIEKVDVVVSEKRYEELMNSVFVYKNISGNDTCFMCLPINTENELLLKFDHVTLGDNFIAEYIKLNNIRGREFVPTIGRLSKAIKFDLGENFQYRFPQIQYDSGGSMLDFEEGFIRSINNHTYYTHTFRDELDPEILKCMTRFISLKRYRVLEDIKKEIEDIKETFSNIKDRFDTIVIQNDNLRKAIKADISPLEN